LVAVLGLLALPVAADDLNIDAVPEGTIVFQLITADGKTVEVEGVLPSAPGENRAVIFNTSAPTGGDFDLGTPNELYGGPGIGAGGVTNDLPLYHVLIVAENLRGAGSDGIVDDPDDADEHGEALRFDFSSFRKGVTINSITYLDVEAEQGEDGAEIVMTGPDISPSSISMPPTGNNGRNTIDGIGISGVTEAVVTLNGSGAIETIVFEEEVRRPCWITFGGHNNASIEEPGKDFSFGGNVGPPAHGSINVVDHITGDHFHSSDVRMVECIDTGTTGPQQPGGKKGLEVDKAIFACDDGKLNGVSGYTCTGYLIDGGEPQGKKGNDPDYFEVVVTDPDTGDVMFVASGEITGGNGQLHPPVPNK
jgi:hypothetical protein